MTTLDKINYWINENQIKAAAKYVFKNNSKTQWWPSQPQSWKDVRDLIHTHIFQLLEKLVAQLKLGENPPDGYWFTATGGFWIFAFLDEDHLDIQVLVEPTFKPDNYKSYKSLGKLKENLLKSKE